MASGIFKALNIEKEEISSVSILIFQSVFLGIFAGAFDVGAQSLFIETYGAALIPKAFAISGGVGIIITSLYSFLQRKLKFSLFAIINLIFVAILTFALRFGFELFHDDRLVFATFVMMGPLTIISFLGFWGTVGRMFTLRQGKRLFGLIDTGQIIGIILASYAIPLLISFKFEVLNSLYICSGSILLALIVQIIISSRFTLEKVESAPVVKEEKQIKSSFWSLFTDPYTFLMTFFVVLSVLAAFFIHYSFLSVTEENYPKPDALASFIGMFMGTLMAFTLIFKTFVYGRLMKTYGLKVALLVSPLILAVFTIGAAIVGSLYGYTAESASFTFFFLLIVSGKLFSKSFKDSIEVPSSKILYQTLDVSIRYDVQARIDGTVNELAAFSAGLLMAGLAMFSGFKLIHFSLVLIVILVLWIFSAFRLYNAYRDSLNASLQKFQKTKIGIENKSIMSKAVDQNKRVELKNILNFLPQSWNGFISSNIDNLLSADDEVQTIALSWVGKLNIVESQDQLISVESKIPVAEKSILRKLINRFNIKKTDFKSEQIKKMAKSENPDDRLKAITAIRKSESNEYSPLLMALLRDAVPSVKIAAIRTTGKLNLLELSATLIDLLADPDYYSFAYHALKEMDQNIISRLEQGYNRTGISNKEKIRIIRLMSDSDSPELAKFLLNKIEEQNPDILIEVLNTLGKTGYQANEFYANRLFQVLHRQVGITAWNLSVQYSVKENKLGDDLYNAFDEELKSNYDIIFAVLALLYDPQSVYHIRKNLESGTSEGIGFAIELLDIFVHETVKPYLFPLLEDTSVIDKINSLQVEYPLEVLKSVEIIDGIINRDYNYIHPLTRFLAIKAIEEVKNYKLSNDLIAQLFNPDLAIAEMAAIESYNLDDQVFERLGKRLGKSKATHLRSIVENTGKDKLDFLNIYSLFNITPLFNEFTRQSLFNISRFFRLIHIKKGESLKLSVILSEDKLIFIENGELSIAGKNIQQGSFFSSEEFISKEDESLNVNQDATLLMIGKKDFQELLFDNEVVYFPFIEFLKEPVLK
jgi:AAA family ATP:ADP antiporter